MKLTLDGAGLLACQSAVQSVVKAGTAKEPQMKPNSTDFKVLHVNRSILGKIEYAISMAEKRELNEHELEFNRQEAKVLIATMLLTSQLQANVLAEYEKRPEDHKAFADADGRRKADYVTRLKARINDVNSVLTRLRLAL